MVSISWHQQVFYPAQVSFSQYIFQTWQYCCLAVISSLLFLSSSIGRCSRQHGVVWAITWDVQFSRFSWLYGVWWVAIATPIIYYQPSTMKEEMMSLALVNAVSTRNTIGCSSKRFCSTHSFEIVTEHVDKTSRHTWCMHPGEIYTVHLSVFVEDCLLRIA